MQTLEEYIEEKEDLLDRTEKSYRERRGEMTAEQYVLRYSQLEDHIATAKMLWFQQNPAKVEKVRPIKQEPRRYRILRVEKSFVVQELSPSGVWLCVGESGINDIINLDEGYCCECKSPSLTRLRTEKNPID